MKTGSTPRKIFALLESRPPIFSLSFLGTRRSWQGGASCVRSRRRFFFFLRNTLLLWQILNATTHLAEIRAPEPQNNSKNNGTNFTRGRKGQIPVIRCFVQNFYMVAYVTKAGLGPEPEFALLFRSFCRWSRLILRHSAYLLRLYCLLFPRWSRLNSRRQVLPGRPVPTLFKLIRQVFWRCKNLNGCLYDLFHYIF